MQVMILAKSTPETESAERPTEGWEELARYTQELVDAGMLLASGRLEDSSKGARVRFGGSRPTVVDGPFTEAKELIAGYWIWQVRSFEEAIEWLKRAPFPEGHEVEVRPIADAEVLAEAR